LTRIDISWQPKQGSHTLLLAQSVFSCHNQSVNCTTSALLTQVELEWLIDDAIANIQEAGQNAWKPVSWKQLRVQLSLGEDATMQCKVQMRGDISNLTDVWKRRIQERQVLLIP
jgi:hypothetical protein